MYGFLFGISLFPLQHMIRQESARHNGLFLTGKPRSPEGIHTRIPTSHFPFFLQDSQPEIWFRITVPNISIS